MARVHVNLTLAVAVVIIVDIHVHYTCRSGHTLRLRIMFTMKYQRVGDPFRDKGTKYVLIPCKFLVLTVKIDLPEVGQYSEHVLSTNLRQPFKVTCLS